MTAKSFISIINNYKYYYCEIKYFISLLCYTSAFYFLRIFPIKNNKIVFCNLDGKGFGDNPKYIALSLLKANLDVELVWLVESYDNNIPEQIKQVKYHSFLATKELVTSYIWVDNSRKPLYTRKRRNQFYIQTWHGSIMLKKIERDAEDKLPKKYIQSAINDSNMIDLCISNSAFFTKFCRSSFWYSGEIFECGSPKSDIFFKRSNLQLISKIRNKLGIDSNTSILLYAPTFRKSNNSSIFDIDIMRILEILKSNSSNKWVALLRFHPNMMNYSSNFAYNDYILNASQYSDMQELLMVSDILITDYSSTMFEFSYMKKPVFLFARDIDSYANERGLYFDLYNLPFPLATNMDELCNNIQQFKNDIYSKKIDLLHKSLGLHEKGEASSSIFYLIKSKIKNLT